MVPIRYTSQNCTLLVVHNIMPNSYTVLENPYVPLWPRPNKRVEEPPLNRPWGTGTLLPIRTEMRNKRKITGNKVMYRFLLNILHTLTCKSVTRGKEHSIP